MIDTKTKITAVARLQYNNTGRLQGLGWAGRQKKYLLKGREGKGRETMLIN
jgi:hypothetical protein